MARRFATEGARQVVVADVDGDAAEAVAREIGGTAVHADLSTEAGNVEAVRAAERHGALDLLCLNAGIFVGGGVEVPDEEWYRIWEINVMAHVWAVRAALPAMLARGEGYILTTASAAGLLTNVGAAPYSVTKHAAVALAEWLAVTHGDDGIKVSCLCPQGVRTRMLFPDDGEDVDDVGASTVRSQGVVEPDDVAEAVVEALDEERFLVLPHPEVVDHFRKKASDHDRWLAGMRRLQARARG
jgi:NAD(P)-dependent dehydrogenase (short-subunit alcohol dehydrogenase family)